MNERLLYNIAKILIVIAQYIIDKPEYGSKSYMDLLKRLVLAESDVEIGWTRWISK